MLHSERISTYFAYFKISLHNTEVCYSEYNQCLPVSHLTLHVDLTTGPPEVNTPRSGPLPLSVKWGLWEVPPHLYHLKMVLKVGGACGRQPIGALPGQTDTVLSRFSVNSGSVLAGGRCHRHRPAKQSVLLKGVACPTHTHT